MQGKLRIPLYKRRRIRHVWLFKFVYKPSQFHRFEKGDKAVERQTFVSRLIFSEQSVHFGFRDGFCVSEGLELRRGL